MSKVYVRSITTTRPAPPRHYVKRIVAVLALCAIAFTASASEEPTKHWGVTIDWNKNLSDFEALVKAPVQYQGTFLHLGNDNTFPFELAAPLKASGKTLVIFWEAMDYNREPSEQPEFSYDSINSGQWDSKVRTLATEAQNYGGPVIFIPFSEMNGDWTPTGQGLYTNTPEKHRQAYRRIWNIFHEPSTNATNVQFGWAVNNVPADVITSYYPGDDVVDYIGVDGFNWGSPWESYEKVFEDSLKELSKLKPPLMIFSFASASGPEKSAWMYDAFLRIQRNPRIVGWIWFNFKKEQDWRVDSDTESLAVFQHAVQNTR